MSRSTIFRHGILVLASLLSAVLPIRANPEPGDDPELEAQRQALEQLMEELPALDGADPSLAIPRLGEIVGKTFMPSVFQVEERWAVHNRAKAMLVGIPGHAEYYKELIGKTRDNILAERRGEPWPHQNGFRSSYNTARLYAFETLALLPSPETVGVLGDYLKDWESIGYNGDPRSKILESGGLSPNGILAAKALGQLIENPPVQMSWGDYSFDEAEVWQLWYEQVKAGNRTFRFKGDPQDYNLEGPVSSSVIPVERRSASGNPSNGASGKQGERRSVSVAVLVAACGALGLAVFVLWRGRHRKPA